MSHRSMTAILAAMILALGLTAGVAGAQTVTSAYWSDITLDAIAPAGDRVIVPDRFRTVTLDREAIAAFLARAPLEGTRAADNRPVIELPLPGGEFGRFAIVESPIMAPELGARYPELRTYAGYGLDDQSARVRFDLTPSGFHALIFSTAGAIYIDPFQRGDDRHYQSYYKRDFRSHKGIECTVVDEDGMGIEIDKLAQNTPPRSGTQLRTYRAAVAATGEYTAYFGGTVARGMEAIVNSMNRVDGVYELEVSIRMVLVPNNDLLVYTNAATDPYTNSSGSTMLGQNQTTIDSVIGTANYDIGHVFSTGGGGIAGLGVVCRAGMKARGVTGSPAPVGDAFDIDYVAHEMGHQFGGNHPFNGTGGNCAGGNRVAAAAYEPGSGSTIMAYAGICAPQDLQAHSDDYFLWYSIQEIITYSTTSYGNGCPVTTATGVIEPIAEAGPTGFAIPLNTPFKLTASATTTGTPTFCWEETDLGPAGAPGTPSGNAPIFRSFLPVASPVRTFPKLSNLLNNTYTIGEILPTYARTLSFAVTVRDAQAGGIGVSRDFMVMTVASSGPFRVTSPNAAVSWPDSSQQTITWNVAGTDAAPVNCSSVNILLSIDGGYTWPIVLASGTPNDGSELVTLQAGVTNLARVKVEAAANVFFDISNANFHITAPLITGSCCALEGTCTLTTQAACTSPSIWGGVGTTCTPNPCIQPTGACCSPEYACTVTLEADCSTADWTMFGVCDPNPCLVGVNDREVVTIPGIQATPNPFTGSVTLRVAGPNATAARVLVFDAAGRQVRTAWDGMLNGRAFTVTWDGRDDHGREAPAGIYLVRLEGAPGSAVSRVVLIR